MSIRSGITCLAAAVLASAPLTAPSALALLTAPSALALLTAPSALALLAGCGDPDGSGVDEDKPLSALTLEERAKYCQWSTGVVGGPSRTATCNGLDIQGATVEQCEAQDYSGCTRVTVGMAEGCSLTSSKDLCAAAADTRCLAIAACVSSTGGGS
jgi:hypothetical protein